MTLYSNAALDKLYAMRDEAQMAGDRKAYNRLSAAIFRKRRSLGVKAVRGIRREDACAAARRHIYEKLYKMTFAELTELENSMDAMITKDAGK